MYIYTHVYTYVGIDIDVDVDSDMAVAVNWGPLKWGVSGSFKRLEVAVGVDIGAI